MINASTLKFGDTVYSVSEQCNAFLKKKLKL